MDNFIVVSKKEAIRRIMEAPGDSVIMGEFSISTHIHKPSVTGTKEDGKRLIVAANGVEYQNNDFFGTLALRGISEELVIRSILFPQIE